MAQYKLVEGDALAVLQNAKAQSFQTCVTSPPYYGLRDYGHDGQIGLEETPEQYVAKLVEVFREVRRVLRDDGTLWLNLGDSFWGGKGKSGYELPEEAEARRGRGETMQHAHNVPGYRDMRPTDGKHPVIKPKDLVGIPWMAAFALRADGWYLRSDCIWHKPNPMPESVKDRPTKAHEYIFLLSKSAKYYYDADAIKEPTATYDEYERDRDNTKQNNTPGRTRMAGLIGNNYERRNKRSVWTVTTKPYKGAHFATFPPDLIEPCILAGSRENDFVLDPFCGSGTTGVVALKHGRRFVGIDLNPDYLALAEKRIQKDVYAKS